MYQKKWDDFCKFKLLGGFYFCDLKVFNFVFFVMKGWGFLNDEIFFFVRVIKVCYFLKLGFVEFNWGLNLSFIWCNLWGIKSLFFDGLKWQIGQGFCVNVWLDFWFFGKERRLFIMLVGDGFEELKVGDLVDRGLCEWDMSLL